MLIALMLISSLLAGHAMARDPRNWVHMVGFIRLDAYDQVLVDVRERMK